MRGGGNKNRLVIAGVCCLGSALLVGIPVDTAIALRFFSAGVLTGTAMFLILVSQLRWFK